MNENNKSNISKDDLLNVREIIEKEMHQEVTDPLFLTDIISIDENKTDKNKLKVLSKFWKKLGSKVVIMDAKKHDIIFSLTSHLPHLIAYNLIQTATEFEKRKRYNLLNFSAGGLRDFSRIAAVSYTHLTLPTNREV